MADTGDMITRKEIRATMCPFHGEFCSYGSGQGFCRARVKKAIYLKHAKRMKALHNACVACENGSGYHVHFG